MRPLLSPWLGLFLALGTALGADELTEGFQSPPPEAEVRVWWDWMNGNVTREGITADLESMATSGIGGATVFCLAGPNHPCDIPPGPADYLGPLWLDMLDYATHEAKRLGLELGMQNCAGWSTTGGPWITPELATQHLTTSQVTITGGQRIQQLLPRPEMNLDYYRDVAVFAIPAELDSDFRIHRWTNKAGQTASRAGRQPELDVLPEGSAIPRNRVIELTGQLTADGTLTWDAPPGNWHLIRIGHTPSGMTNKPAPPNATGLETDKLRPEGLDIHWKHGIQPVLDRLGDQVGHGFNEIIIDSYEAGLNHWTPKMRDEFTRRRGYDPGPYLLALTGRAIDDGPSTERFYWDFRRTVGDLFVENYYSRMAGLCHEHGLKFVVEPYTSCYEGLQVGSRADIPMAEFWVSGRMSSSLALAASSAHTNGQRFAAAEAFTASPEIGRWLNHPGTLKKSGDMAWTEGINRLVLHSWAHQPWLDLEPGMTMGQYGTHFGRTNTWWRAGRAWFDYLNRSQFLLQHGDPVADVLCFAGNAVPNKTITRRDLDGSGYRYDSCSTESFLALDVKNGSVVLPTGRAYPLLVLPDDGGFHLPSHARKLRELVAAGARVLGPRPLHTPSLENFPASETEVVAIGREVWGDIDGSKVTSHVFGKGLVMDGVDATTALQQLGIAPQAILPPGLTWIQRHSAKADIFFITNPTDRRVSGEVRLRASGKKPEIWDAVAGRISHPVGWTNDGTHTHLPLDLAAGASAFVVFREAGRAEKNPVMKVDAISATAPAEHATDHPGQVRLWSPGTYQLHHASGSPSELAVTGLADAFELKGPWQLAFQAGRGAPAKAVMNELAPLQTHPDPGIRYFSGTCGYRIDFDWNRDADTPGRELWLDLGQVHVIAEVTLNGQPLGTLWYPPFRVNVGSAIRHGHNTLEVAVTNLWVNRLIGDAKLPEDCEWEGKALKRWPDWLTGKQPRPSGRITFATWNHWGPQDPLQPSGLVGPVALREARVVRPD